MRDVHATFVPGAAGLGAFWEPVMARLPQSWQKRTLDLPGLGAAPPHPDVNGYDDLVDYVARGIVVPSVVVGQSMGGFISLKLALRYPELVTHLVLVVAAAGVDMARLGAKDWRPSNRESHGASPTWPHEPVPDLTPELCRISVPVLLVWATRDPISPIGVAHELAERLPNARLISFDTDDHWVARQFAEPTCQAIVDFVSASR